MADKLSTAFTMLHMEKENTKKQLESLPLQKAITLKAYSLDKEIFLYETLLWTVKEEFLEYKEQYVKKVFFIWKLDIWQQIQY